MLIHIIPRIYRPIELAFIGKCQLKKLSIPELDFTLTDSDLKTGTPYPNKNYFVASRKEGRKHLFGLLIETKKDFASLTVMCEWNIEGLDQEQSTATHEIKINLLDNEHDAISTDVLYWKSMSESLGGWEDRTPTIYKSSVPLWLYPDMRLMQSEEQVGVTAIEQGFNGIVRKQSNKIDVPTIQRERFRTFGCDRFPGLESAYVV
ncbi:DUF6012 family protein [Vibrio sp. S512-13]|uniref:DUF6012 family protein n=1 Tax=Vibrio sp. S512-13 TaxID=1620394 RepID=UPI0005EFE58F|nr:DUF6012 family protein [Vibrio sp. S512-13]KJQ88412.1 hypothetical protein UG53_02835 [Vibrio sp. S512-13]KJQ88417.1 hypothetical protein UG53_02860 [Vibrio sp. S512-13]